MSPLVLLALLPGSLHAQLAGVTDVQLSDPQHAGSDVDTSFQNLIFSSDGRYACFVGDTETDGANELWCADTTAGMPAVRVSGLLPTGTTVQRPRFSDDGTLVFYVAPGPDSSKRDLFMVPPDGSAVPVRLNAPLVPSGVGIGAYEYVPATRQMVYQADSQFVGQSRLHIVSIDQPEIATILNGPLVAGGEVDSFEVVPAANRVVYLADQQTDSVPELYSVRFNGTGAAKLNGPLVSGGFVQSFEVAPDGSRVAYLADEDTDEVRELYVSAVDGGGSSKISGTAVAGGDVRFYFFSPDSQWLMFLGDLAINGWRHLYSSPSDGSQLVPHVLATQVQEAPEAPGIELVPQLQVTSDGDEVMFASLQGDPSTTRILKAPLDGSAPASVLSGGLTQVSSRFQYVPGIDRLVIRSTTTPANLFSVAIDNSSFFPLTSFSDPSIQVIETATPFGVVYRADPSVDDRFSMFFVDYFGQATRTLSSSSPLFRGVESIPYFSPSRDWMYFIERINTTFAAFSTDRLKLVDLASGTVKEMAVISNSALVTGDREFLRILPNPVDRHQALYVADKLVDEQVDAFLVTLEEGVFSDRFQ
jgi:dipeptidyl aminopeptidase/acylaminoacyl peptidase